MKRLGKIQTNGRSFIRGSLYHYRTSGDEGRSVPIQPLCISEEVVASLIPNVRKVSFSLLNSVLPHKDFHISTYLPIDDSPLTL